VDEAAVDVWTLGAWKEVAKAKSIGALRLWKIEETSTDKVRLRVTQAAACPALSDFGLFLEPPAPLWSPMAEQSNPIEQVVKFPNEVTTRYLRFTAEHVVASDHMAVAELGVIESDAK
jgi:hypothetical protein